MAGSSGGGEGPGKLVFLIVSLIWTIWVIHMSMAHGLVGLSLWFAWIATVIVWIVDVFFLDSMLGDRTHRGGIARGRAKHPTPFPAMSHSFEELSGAPDWKKLRDHDGH